MHELSIAQAMIRQIEEIMDREKGDRITLVRLELGLLSGIDREALEFAFPFAAEGTSMAEAVLDIEEVPIKIRCLNCQNEAVIETPFDLCPKCGSSDKEIISGKDFILKSFDVE